MAVQVLHRYRSRPARVRFVIFMYDVNAARRLTRGPPRDPAGIGTALRVGLARPELDLGHPISRLSGMSTEQPSAGLRYAAHRDDPDEEALGLATAPLSVDRPVHVVLKPDWKKQASDGAAAASRLPVASSVPCVCMNLVMTPQPERMHGALTEIALARKLHHLTAAAT